MTVDFDCADLVSGVAACSEPVTLTGEGVDQLVTGEVSDFAGNTNQADVTVSIDVTAPEVTLLAPVDGTSVLLADYAAPMCSATDALSGLDGACSVEVTDPTPVVGGLVYTATAIATDHADNVTAVSSTYTVIIDDEAPIIVATPDRDSNSAGWYAGTVTYTFEWYDSGTRVDVCPGPVTVSGEGAGQSFMVTAVDNAGNEGELTVAGNNIDTTAPTRASRRPSSSDRRSGVPRSQRSA